MYKKIFAAFTAAVLCLGISSCGKNGKEQVLEVTAATTADGKKIIKMYAWRVVNDKQLYDCINDFNRINADYRVELTEYINEYDDPLIRLNTDITTGNAPDILVVSREMPIGSYLNKGLFADLYEFIDNDPDMEREAFLESIFKAYENDGKLCELVPQFSIDTVVGKASLVGDKRGRTAGDFIKLAETYPDKKMMNGYTTKSSALDTLIRYSYGSFIDKNSGECSFDGEEFAALLKFCDRFPFEISEDYFENENLYYDEFYELFNGDILFYSGYTIIGFTDLRRIENGIFGEPVTFMGYPGAGGNGSVIKPGAEYAILDNSPNKDGAWAFLRNFYTEEYQDGIIDSPFLEFPVRLSSLEVMAENAKRGRYSALEKEYEEPTWNQFGKEIKLGLNTDENNRRIYDLINSAAGTMENDYYIYKIITDESATYFAGQKSAEEAAAIIQNRVQNYLDENR